MGLRLFIAYVAVITGASRGIGRATAFELASRGCQIVGTCSSPSSLHHFDDLRKAIDGVFDSQQIPKILGIVANIEQSPSSTAVAVAEALKTEFGGKLNIFVNNAAKTDLGAPGQIEDQHVTEFLTANIHVPVALVEQFVRQKLFQPYSRIICIASVRARRTAGMMTLYAATKSADEALCRCWAEAFGGRHSEYDYMAGTTANSVVVGYTNTELLDTYPVEAKAAATTEFMEAQAIPRLGQPQDVAQVVGLLAREESRWITGTSVAADGGYLQLA